MPIKAEAEKAILKAARKEGVAATAIEDLKQRYERGDFKADRARSVREYLNSIRSTNSHLFGEKLVSNKSNPWRLDQWSITEQGRLVKAIGIEASSKIAAAAHSGVGWTEEMTRKAAIKRNLAK